MLTESSVKVSFAVETKNRNIMDFEKYVFALKAAWQKCNGFYNL